jgi:biopolymer transport protein ExbD
MRKRDPLYKKEIASEEGLINMTPLIDVVFVVLIMFIIVAPMLELDKVQLATSGQTENKPKSNATESSPVTIHVRADNTIWMNAKSVTVPQLTAILKDAHRKHPHRTPQLFHDKKAQFGTYQSIKNAVEEAGFEEMDVILQPH